jgi:hypothetical protein
MVVLTMDDVLVLFILGVMAIVFLGMFLKEVLSGFWKSVKRFFGHE